MEREGYLFEHPGTVKDILFAAPIMYQFAKQYNISVDVCIPYSCKAVAGILSKQEWVNKVSFGEEPRKIEKDPKDKHWQTELIAPDAYKSEYLGCFNLSYRAMPDEFLTTSLAKQVELPINMSLLTSEQCIKAEIKPARNLCVCVSSSTSIFSNTVKEAYLKIKDELSKEFENIYLIGSGDVAEELGCTAVEDSDNLVKISELLEDSVLLTPPGRISALAYCIKSRSVNLVPPKMPGGNPGFYMHTTASKGVRQISIFDGYPRFTLSQIRLLKSMK